MNVFLVRFGFVSSSARIGRLSQSGVQSDLWHHNHLVLPVCVVPGEQLDAPRTHDTRMYVASALWLSTRWNSFCIYIAKLAMKIGSACVLDLSCVCVRNCRCVWMLRQWDIANGSVAKPDRQQIHSAERTPRTQAARVSELKLFKNSHPGDDAQRSEAILKFKLTSSEVGHTHTHTAVESFCLLDFKRAAIEHRRQTVSKIRRSHTLLCRMYVSNRTILQSTSATYPFN